MTQTHKPEHTEQSHSSMPPWLVRMKGLGPQLAISYMGLLIGAMVVFLAGMSTILLFQLRHQLWHYAIQDIETVEGLMEFSQGTLIVRDDYHNHPESKRILERYLEVLSPDGTILYQNERLGNRRLAGELLPDEGVEGYSQRVVHLAGGVPVLMVSRRYRLQNQDLLIRLGYSEEAILHSIYENLGAAVGTAPFMLFIAALFGYRMSRDVLEPIHKITSQAERITSHRLHERLPVNGSGDEIDHLAQVFNQSLARLDQSFQQMRQFTSDASHELRTPLAAIRSIGEVGLQQGKTDAEYQEIIGSMLEEAGRLSALTEDLLQISRADSGAIPLKCSLLSAAALTEETASLLEPLAEEKAQKLILPQLDDACVMADEALMRQAIMNILHNAIKYSPARSTISIRVQNMRKDSVTISIQDAGPGIAPEHVPHIFDRFYRADHGRARETGGFGLGLAFANWAIAAHGGTIGVTSKLHEGSTFQITLPALGLFRPDGYPDQSLPEAPARALSRCEEAFSRKVRQSSV